MSKNLSFLIHESTTSEITKNIKKQLFIAT